MDTLAVRLTIPRRGLVGDFHPQVSASCRAHTHRVGGSLAAPVLPHHRTYGYVYGGSSSTLEPSPLNLQRQQSAAIKVGLWEGRVHVRGSGIPPGTSPILACPHRSIFVQSALHHTLCAREYAFPLPPDYAP